MIFAETKGIDWVAAWKAGSILLTGGFGILGLFTEFKNKDSKKINKWGYVSLIGIVVSTVLGTAAQIKESDDDAKKTLAILTGIQSELSPSVADLKFEFSFKLRCSPNGPCTKITSFKPIDYRDEKWSEAFGKGDNRVKVTAFIDPPDPGAAAMFSIKSDDQKTPYYATASYLKNDYALFINADPSAITIDSNNGMIHSLIDLDGKELTVVGQIGISQLRLAGLTVYGKTGERLECGDIQFVEKNSEAKCVLQRVHPDF